LRFIRQSDEVYYTTSPLTTLSAEDMAFLKARSAENPRRRVRLCVHHDVSEPVHEMLIVHMSGHYARPHKHVAKSESFHIIEGRLKIFLFDDDGRHSGIVQMSDPGGGAAFYYRLASSTFHSLLVETEYVVFHEVTNGPFNRAETIWAPWAPEETDIEGQAAYLSALGAYDERSLGRLWSDCVANRR
jgi:cupin fold WbuC family metalloprotein